MLYSKNSITLDKVLSLSIDKTYQAYQVSISFSGDYNSDVGNKENSEYCLSLLNKFNQAKLNEHFKSDYVNRFIKYLTVKIISFNSDITQVTTSIRDSEYSIQSITIEVINN